MLIKEHRRNWAVIFHELITVRHRTDIPADQPADLSKKWHNMRSKLLKGPCPVVYEEASGELSRQEIAAHDNEQAIKQADAQEKWNKMREVLRDWDGKN